MDHRGTLLVISGFSGAGKGTVTRSLKEKYGYGLSVSMTTRQPREGEVDGIDYHFKTEDEFLRLIDYNGFIEYARYVDHYYGTPRKYVEEELERGRTVILEIEVQGAVKIKQQYPDAVLIFITAPDAQSLRERLCGRGTNDEADIEKRMDRARKEAESIGEYDYIVVNENGRPEECMEKIRMIIDSQESKVSRNREFIEKITKDLDK